MNGGTTPEAIAAVADSWWTFGTKQTLPSTKAAIVTHAADLYRRTLDGMAGLRREQVAKRIVEAETVVAAAPTAAKVRRNVKSVELLSRMQGTRAEVRDGIFYLTKNSRIATPDFFKPPIAFRFVVFTEGTDFRIAYAADQIIFNWADNTSELRIDGGPAGGKHKKGAGSVPPMTWVTIDLVVTTKAMTISVDGEQRQRVEADFSKVSDSVKIWPHTSPLRVKSVSVQPADE